MISYSDLNPNDVVFTPDKIAKLMIDVRDIALAKLALKEKGK